MRTSLQPAFQWLEAQYPSLVETLTAWAHINSGSANFAGILEMAKAVTTYSQSLGALVEEIPLAPLQEINDMGELISKAVAPALRLRKRPEATLQVLLVGHLDTVFPANATFQHCRYLDDNTLNGPGVADMKGGILIMLSALQAFEKLACAQKIGWTVILNPDEEVGSLSSYALLAAEAKKHHVGLGFEPSVTPEGMLAGQRKGSGNFTVVFRGKSAHAGRAFQEGRNAICAMAEFITALNALNGQREQVTLNVGKVQGGVGYNVVPELALCRFNVRTYQVADGDWFNAQLTNLLQAFDGKHEVKVTCHGKITRAPKLLTGTTLALFERVKAIGEAQRVPIQWQATGGVCDGNILAEQGLANIDTLGARGGLIHSDQEYILLDSLTERAKLVVAILADLADQGF